jgi:FkbM family methyltransferase
MTRGELRHAVGKFVARHRRARPLAAVASWARAYQWWYANVNYDIAENGELRVLERLASGLTPCAFDVGANRGEWTRTAARHLPGAQIHAFEIVPDTAAELADAVDGLPGVTVAPVGLSDSEGELRIRYYPSASAGSGAHEFPVDVPFEWRNCPVTTGDLYCKAHEIKRVGFLKIDVEGSEQRVLRGFSQMLRDGAIDVIQFEYGFVNIYSQTLLKDFYEQLESFGYAVGKIYPMYVDFRSYDPYRDEDFLGPNYLAVRTGRKDLIARVS